MKLLYGRAELQDGGSEIKCKDCKSVGEANGEVSCKGFQWKEKMGHKRGESGDGKLLERVS